MIIGTVKPTLVMNALAYTDLPTTYNSIQWLHDVQVMQLVTCNIFYVLCQSVCTIRNIPRFTRHG